jgi:hypothetical protein
MPDVDIELKQLSDALATDAALLCVHYACESFLKAKDRPPAVSCIAIKHIARDEVRVVSHRTFTTAAPESAFTGRRFLRKRRRPASPTELERRVLEEFYDYLQRHPDAQIVHWNMNSASFGFDAIADRYHNLTGKKAPVTLPTDRVHDLDSIIGRRYGEDYASHPKMKDTAELNNCSMRSFVRGDEEATAFEDRDFPLIESSTRAKVDIISRLLRLTLNGSLRTRNSAGMVAVGSGHLEAVEVVLHLGTVFRDIMRSLKIRRTGRTTLEVKDEYDAQDLMRVLLRVFFSDCRDETWTPNYAGASAKIDFWLDDYSLAIELKHTRPTLGDRDLADELIVDRDRYKQNRSARHLVCLVFDYDGHLKNPRGLEKDLSKEASSEGIAVTVRIFDR